MITVVAVREAAGADPRCEMLSAMSTRHCLAQDRRGGMATKDLDPIFPSSGTRSSPCTYARRPWTTHVPARWSYMWVWCRPGLSKHQSKHIPHALRAQPLAATRASGGHPGC